MTGPEALRFLRRIGVSEARRLREQSRSVPAPTAAMISTVNDLIDEIANEFAFDRDFFRKVIRLESGFNPNAVSPTGAIGLGQITSPALAQYNVSHSDSPVLKEELTDPETNLRVSVWYLIWVASVLLPNASDLSVLTADQRALIYGGYNVGVGTVRKMLVGKSDRSVARLVSYQASALSKDGVAGYLSNVREHVA